MSDIKKYQAIYKMFDSIFILLKDYNYQKINLGRNALIEAEYLIGKMLFGDEGDRYITHLVDNISEAHNHFSYWLDENDEESDDFQTIEYCRAGLEICYRSLQKEKEIKTGPSILH